MKKTFTRALSLILVLVMLVGVMPMAFAKVAKNATVTLNSTTANLKVGEKHQVSVTGMTSEGGSEIAPADITSVSYKDYDSEVISVSDTGEITALKAGETGLTVEATASKENWTYDHVGGAEITIVVTADSETPPPSGGEGDGEGEEPVVTYEVKLDPATLTLAVGEESEPLSVIVKKTVDGEESVLPTGKYSIEGWLAAKKDGKDIVTVDGDGKVTGVAAGTTTVEVSVLLEGETEERTAQCTVTVTDAVKPVIECKGAYVKPTETYTLRPVLKINDIVISDVDFKFVPSAAFVNSVVTASDKDSATISNRYGGAVEVTVSVERYKIAGSDSEVSGDDVDVEPIKVRVWFYDTNNISVTLRSGKTKITLDDEKVFSKININGSDLNAFYNDMSFARVFEYLMEGEMGDYKGKPKMVYFENLSGYSSGQIVDTHGYALSSKEWGFLDQVWFAQSGNRTGTASFSYKIVDDEGLTIMTGTCDVIITGGEGDIHYETTSSKPITLKEVDFQNFWTEQKMGNQYTLSYVTFDVTGMSGVLYTDNTKKTVVTAGMNFYLNPARGEHDLGSVYYVPNVKDTSEYVDSFNFRVFSNYNSTNASGTVTIGVNTKAATNISSRGVVMGATHSKAIYDIYKSNSGTTLGYVVFELPEAKYGKLYRALPTSGGHTKVAEGEELKLTDKLWYDSKVAGDLPLSSLAFIPAAGFKGEVELHYTAYDAYGNNQYNGKLRFNVTTKTASGVFSDVTAKNYSWAADSADFLYYEGTAQGSNGKYNPAAKITRQDFMLMLYRAFLAKDYGTFNVTSNFPDVVKGTSDYTREIYQAVGVAKYLGIAQGSNNKFNPKSNITRQEAMVLIYRTLDVINKDLEYTTTTNITAFKDYNKISSWATASITYLVNHGVIQGSNDKINPSANITRAEMACILHRVLTY